VLELLLRSAFGTLARLVEFAQEDRDSCGISCIKEPKVQSLAGRPDGSLLCAENMPYNAGLLSPSGRKALPGDRNSQLLLGLKHYPALSFKQFSKYASKGRLVSASALPQVEQFSSSLSP
jgi:hypothetical protein